MVMLTECARTMIDRVYGHRVQLGWRARRYRFGEEWDWKGGTTEDVRMMSLESER